jgi:predicted aspartyl protease
MAREIKTRVKLWNYADEVLAQRGFIGPEEVKSVELEEAIVDTGAVRLVLNEALVQTLGLPLVGEITVRYADHRTARKRVARGVMVEIMGREGIFDAILEERGQPLIGMEVLEALDLWPDPQRGVLTTNPLSPDMPLYNLLGTKPCQSR